MTLGFESENLYLFEEGSRRLTLVDVASWRGWWMDFERLGIGLSDATLDTLAGHVRDGAVRLAREAQRLRGHLARRAARAVTEEGGAEAPTSAVPEPAPEAEEGAAAAARLEALAAAALDERDPMELAQAAIARATQALAALVPLRASAEQLDLGYRPAATGLLRPTRLTAWLWAGDSPAESFHAEDYEPGQVEPLDARSPAEFVDFGVTFESIRGEQHQFPVTEEGGYCAISLPADFVSEARPDPLRALPILDDYVGPGGVGVAGLASNLADDGTMAAEARLAIPLLRGGALFLTLYLHAALDGHGDEGATAGLAHRLLVGRAEEARAALARLGFVRHHREDATGPVGARLGASGEVWTRGEERDVVHLYENLPGREALHRGVSPPTLLAVRAGGGFDLGARTALLGAVRAEL